MTFVVRREGESLSELIRRFKHLRMTDGIAAAYHLHEEAQSRGERRRFKRLAAERRRPATATGTATTCSAVVEQTRPLSELEGLPNPIKVQPSRL